MRWLTLFLLAVLATFSIQLAQAASPACVQQGSIACLPAATNPQSTDYVYGVTTGQGGGAGGIGVHFTLSQISGGGGSGITQLTGGVTAGPGSGSQAATLVLTAGSNVTGVLSPVNGGTGVNNGSNTITTSLPFAITGSGAQTFFFGNSGVPWTYNFPQVSGNLAYQVGSFVSGDCLQASGTAGGIADAGAICGSGGTGITQLTGGVTAGPGSGSQAATLVLTAGSGVTGVLAGVNGGTGVANTGKTLTLGGSITTTGAATPTLAFGASTFTYTFPGATANLGYQVGSITSGHCLQASGTAGGFADAGAICGSGGSGITQLTGDVTAGPGSGSQASTLATVNSNVGSFTNANITVNAKGLITAAANGSGSGVSVTAGTPDIVVNPTPGTGTFTVGTTVPLNTQSGASYAVLTGDNASLIEMTNASATTMTIPLAGSTGFTSGWGTSIYPTISQTTLTPASGTVCGQSSLALDGTQFVSLGTGSGTNYDCAIGFPASVPSGTIASGKNLGLDSGGHIVVATVSGGSGCTVSGAAGIVLNNGSSACTTDTNALLTAGALSLGASGTAGSVSMGNATTGTVTLQPVTGALGSVTASLPANTGTIAELNLAQTFTASQRAGYQTPTISTATFTPAVASGNNIRIGLTSACPCTLANFSGSLVAGQQGVIEIAQDGTGSRLIGTWGSEYVTAGGTSTITLSTAASTVDYLPYAVDSTASVIVLGALIKGPTH